MYFILLANLEIFGNFLHCFGISFVEWIGRFRVLLALNLASLFAKLLVGRCWVLEVVALAGFANRLHLAALASL